MLTLSVGDKRDVPNLYSKLTASVGYRVEHIISGGILIVLGTSFQTSTNRLAHGLFLTNILIYTLFSDPAYLHETPSPCVSVPACLFAWDSLSLCLRSRQLGRVYLYSLPPPWVSRPWQKKMTSHIDGYPPAHEQWLMAFILYGQVWSQYMD